jgi:hypothetical protein
MSAGGGVSGQRKENQVRGARRHKGLDFRGWKTIAATITT